MAKVEIDAGICGFKTQVETLMSKKRSCSITIKSSCQHIQKLAEELAEVDPFREISFRGEGPITLQLATKYCSHTACPVPTGIIKAVEVAAGLALPQDAIIRVSKDD